MKLTDAEQQDGGSAIVTPDKEPVARLKRHIRRMAFQMLGPEPRAEGVPSPVASPQPADQRPEAKIPAPPISKKTKRLDKLPAPAPKSSEPEATSIPANGSASIMEQYRAAKERHPGMLLLFRIGDFYELFEQDAETGHKALGLTLTTRDRTITMAGFPHHQLQAYLHKLLNAGHATANWKSSA